MQPNPINRQIISLNRQLIDYQNHHYLQPYYGCLICLPCTHPGMCMCLFICVFGYTLAMNHAVEWKHLQTLLGDTHTPKTTHTQDRPTMFSHTYCTCAYLIRAYWNSSTQICLHHHCYTQTSKAALSTAAVQLQPNHWHEQHQHLPAFLKHKLLILPTVSFSLSLSALPAPQSWLL